MTGEQLTSGNGRCPASRALIGWPIAIVLAAGMAVALAAGAAAAAPKTAPATTPRTGSHVPTPAWTPANEWTIGGVYAETCSDLPVCGALFGVPPADGLCRKVIAIQLLNGRYRNTNLSGLCAAVIVESPPGAQATQANRREWRRCDLLVPEQADSAQAEGLQATIGALISGADAPPFSAVSRVPLAAGFSQQQVTVEAAGLLEMRLHPTKSFNGIRPPEIQNVAGPFPFLAMYFVYEPDTLYYGGAGEPWSWSKRSALTGQFVWTSQATADRAAKQAETPGETKPAGIRGKR